MFDLVIFLGWVQNAKTLRNFLTIMESEFYKCKEGKNAFGLFG